MGFDLLQPAWMLAAPPILGALFILYFLKLKRREVKVASTWLWRRALTDLRVNSPFQRLRMNLLLLLQALALLLALLALARPVSNVGGLTGTDSILLIDVSASMQATDGDGGTRLEQAVREARRIVDDLGYNDRAIVIPFDDEPRSPTPLTGSKGLLREALDRLQPSERATHLGRAMARVQMLLKDDLQAPEVFVFSDGNVGPLAGVGLAEDIPLHFVRVGQAGENLAITGVDVSIPSGLGEDTRVFVAVQRSGGSGPRKVGVDFYLAPERAPEEWQLLGSQEVEVEPDSTTSVAFDVGGDTGRLKVELDHQDALPVDDVAWALLRPQEPIGVVLVSEGNLFLDRALRSDPMVRKDPQGAITVLAPAAFAQADPILREHDMVVLDRCAPDPLPPGNYLCFGTPPKLPGIVDKGFGRDAKILDWDEAHPVARFVNFATLQLPAARRLELREGDQVVVRSSLGPLVSVARDGDRQAVICAFDLLSLPVEGAWTFDPSYPIFLANCVRWLGGRGRDRKSLLVSTGGTAELRLPLDAVRAEITPPAGEPWKLEVRPGDDLLRVSNLDRAGFYHVVFEDAAGKPLRQATFAANLCDGGESRIAPAAKLELEGRPPQLAQDEAAESNRDVWKIAAGIALLCVMLEWWIYNRRVYL